MNKPVSGTPFETEDLTPQCIHGFVQSAFTQPCPTCDKSEGEPPVMDNYALLSSVLDRAYDQAASGKGSVRHGQGLAFEDQPMFTISRLIGSHVGLIYQAIKKAQESQRLPTDAAVKELLGAINYLAGAVIFLEEKDVRDP